MGTVVVPDDPFSSVSKLPVSRAETSQHAVAVKSFAIGRYEATQEEWYSVMGVNPSTSQRGGSLAVVTVSWDEAQEFI